MTQPLIIHADSSEALADMILAGRQVDAIVTDPPYGISFLGCGWDHPDNIAFRADFWRLCFAVLKPGGHLLAFSAAKTYHRMACAIEDAGFEIRDQIMWIYGSGMPKGSDLGKVITKAGGDTSDADAWTGWSTGLKPAHEPICMARKPLSEKSIRENVLRHGTGAINIDGCRVEVAEGDVRSGGFGKGNRPFTAGSIGGNTTVVGPETGRYPANVCHDASDEVEAAFAEYGDRPGYNGGIKQPSGREHHQGVRFMNGTEVQPFPAYGDTGTASRFFYSAKVLGKARVGHPTQKPQSLMEWLITMVVPPGGTVLDPFAGSGTTGIAAQALGHASILIEREAEYVAMIEQRLGWDQAA